MAVRGGSHQKVQAGSVVEDQGWTQGTIWGNSFNNTVFFFLFLKAVADNNTAEKTHSPALFHLFIQIYFFFPPLLLQISSVIHEDGTLDVCYEGYVFRLQLVATPEIEAAQLGMFCVYSLCANYTHIVQIRQFLRFNFKLIVRTVYITSNSTISLSFTHLFSRSRLQHRHYLAHRGLRYGSGPVAPPWCESSAFPVSLLHRCCETIDCLGGPALLFRYDIYN